jgi:hypothetical protein
MIRNLCPDCGVVLTCEPHSSNQNWLEHFRGAKHQAALQKKAAPVRAEKKGIPNRQEKSSGDVGRPSDNRHESRTKWEPASPSRSARGWGASPRGEDGRQSKEWDPSNPRARRFSADQERRMDDSPGHRGRSHSPGRPKHASVRGGDDSMRSPRRGLEHMQGHERRGHEKGGEGMHRTRRDPEHLQRRAEFDCRERDNGSRGGWRREQPPSPFRKRPEDRGSGRPVRHASAERNEERRMDRQPLAARSLPPAPATVSLAQHVQQVKRQAERSAHLASPPRPVPDAKAGFIIEET